MKRTLTLCLCALLCLALCSCASSADSRITQCLTVQAHVDGEWHDLPQEMAYAHTDGLMMDGLLAFAPLDVVLRSSEIDVPVLPWAEDFTFRVLDDGSPQEVTCSARLLSPSEDGFVRLPDDTLDHGVLPEGAYLLQLNFQAKRGNEYYAGSAFAWLLVGDAQVPARYRRGIGLYPWYESTPTPSPRPTPTPLPTPTPFPTCTPMP